MPRNVLAEPAVMSALSGVSGVPGGEAERLFATPDTTVSVREAFGIDSELRPAAFSWERWQRSGAEGPRGTKSIIPIKPSELIRIRIVKIG